MKTFTLEWNAVITLEEQRKGSAEIRELISLHGSQIDLGIVTTAASENTAEREFPKTAREFERRLERSGLQELSRVLTVGVVDLTYFEYCCYADECYENVTSELWKIVKPVSLSSNVKDFAKAKKIDSRLPITAPEYSKWRNKWCDVNSLYAHIRAGRDVFVSGDVKNFRGNKKEKLVELGVGQICSYGEALTLARSL